MSEKILVPVLGESLNEATVSKWLKNVGDFVNSDEAIVELETDKVNLEVPAPVSGVLTEVNSKDGDTVEVGAILGVISEEVKKIDSPNLTKKKEDENKVVSKSQNNVISLEIEKKEKQKINEPLILNEEKPLILTEEVKEDREAEKNKILSPAVRKIITEKKINIDEIKGTGKDGRVLKGDLINLMGINPNPNERKIKFGEEERIKMTRLRQTIAKRLKEAQENAAMLTTFNEVDMSGIISMRKDNQDDFQSRYGVKL